LLGGLLRRRPGTTLRPCELRVAQSRGTAARPAKLEHRESEDGLAKSAKAWRPMRRPLQFPIQLSNSRKTRARRPAARSRPGFAKTAPSTSKRAQGRPGAGRARGPPAAKKQAAVTTGLAEATRPSLRDGFNAYGALSLGTGLSCSHRPQRSSRQQARPQRREARTTRLRRPYRDRSSARDKRALRPDTSIASRAQRSRRSRSAPLDRVRDGADHAPDLGSPSSQILEIRTYNTATQWHDGQFCA